MTMNVLIIGGSGFLSGNVARTALAQGHNVWTITRGQRPVPDGVTSLIADRHDVSAFEATVSGAKAEWDLVVDCIGFAPEDARQDIALFRDRTHQLVFVSTDFVYEPAQRAFPQSEESDHYLSGLYGGKKRLCEREFINGDCGNMAWTIFRPGHIYGPGSRLGCLPLHGRDPELIQKMRTGQTLSLVGGGHFLQQPTFAPDLAALILSVHGNQRAHNQIYCTGGPEVIESKAFYQIIADILGVSLQVEEVAVDEYAAAHPEHASFLCHRFYDLRKLEASGLAVPRTLMVDGLQQHVVSLIQ